MPLAAEPWAASTRLDEVDLAHQVEALRAVLTAP
jgi:hypothetical protein